VEVYKKLIENREISESDKVEASFFNIIPIWAPTSKFDDIMYLLQVLNQNIVGAQKKQSFTKQLLNTRIKWNDMGSLQSTLGSRQHLVEYLVRMISSSLFVFLQ